MFVTKGMPRGHLAVLAVTLPLLVVINAYAQARLDGIASFAVFAFAMIAIIALPTILATVAKLSAKTAMLPERHITLVSALTPEAAFETLRNTPLGKRKVVDIDAERRVLVLSSPISGWNWGRFFPIFVRGAGAGSIIEVGILPKCIELEERLQKALEACVAEVKKTVAA